MDNEADMVISFVPRENESFTLLKFNQILMSKSKAVNSNFHGLQSSRCALTKINKIVLWWKFVMKSHGNPFNSDPLSTLTHWGRATHICVGKLTIIGSDNGLSPGRRQAIIWTNAGIMLMGPLGTNFSEILIATETFSFKKMHLKISSAKWRPCCLGLNVLMYFVSQAVTQIHRAEPYT